jgi:hypothetical protein
MLRIPHCLDSRLTDGCKVVSLTHRPSSTPHKPYVSATGSNFCYRLSNLQGLVRPEGLGKLKKYIHLKGSRTLDLPACTIVPQPTTLPCAPCSNHNESVITYAMLLEPTGLNAICNMYYFRILKSRIFLNAKAK